MMKKLMGLIFGLTVLCLSLLIVPISSQAAVETIFVEDNAHILKDQDIKYIRDLNEITFKNLEGSPQYAVVTLKNLDHADNIEEYAADKFNEMGLGQADLDNGFLFVISIEDREFRLETGYGVEAVITDSMRDEIVGDEVTDLLRDEEYGQAVRQVSENIANVVEKRYSTYAVSIAEIKAEKEATQARHKKLGIGALIIAVFGGISGAVLISVNQIKERQRRRYLVEVLSRFVAKDIELPKGELTLEIPSLWKSKTVKVKPKKTTLVEGLAMRLAMDKRVDYSEAELCENLATTYLRGSVSQYLEDHPESTYPEMDLYLGQSEDYSRFLEEVVLPLFNANHPLRSPELLTGKTAKEFARYMENNTMRHQQNLNISRHNQEVLRKVCLNFCQSAGITFKDTTEEELIIGLMVFVLLAGKDLTDPHLIDKELTSISSLEQAYQDALAKRAKIESGYRNQALGDLNYMMLGLYFTNSSMSMSSYSSAASTSGGGSSFGGGSSGGGGFSGGW